MKPLVSVCVVTYNHEDSIRKCIDGILMQKTTFPFELLLGEDDSSDATREICKEYAVKHPDTIRLFLQSRDNVIYIAGRPTGRYNFLHILENAKGNYIALCEGDDYWTDPSKLQRQVDILEKNPKYSMCFHNTYDEQKDGKRTLKYQGFMKEQYSTPDFLDSAIIRTLSLVYRNNLIGEFPDWFKATHMGDWPLVLMLSTYGDAFYLSEPMGVYSIQGNGVWSGSNAMYRLKGRIHLYEIMSSYLPTDYFMDIQSRLIELYPAFIRNLIKLGEYRQALNVFLKFLKAPFQSQKSYLLKQFKKDKSGLA